MVCYAPSTGTLAVIGVGIYVLWHRTIGHLLGLFGTVLEIALILSVEVVSAIALVWLTRQIRRRRAAAGACTSCRFRCQQALARRPNLLVNRVDRRIPAPARPALTCHPAAPLLPARAAAVLPCLRWPGRHHPPPAPRAPALPPGRPGRPGRLGPGGRHPGRGRRPGPATPGSRRGPFHGPRPGPVLRPWPRARPCVHAASVRHPHLVPHPGPGRRTRLSAGAGSGRHRRLRPDPGRRGPGRAPLATQPR